MKLSKLSIVFLLSLFTSSWFFAQNTAQDSQVRRRLRENINTLRLLRMTQALDLSEDQAARIFPVLNRIEKEKSRIQNQMSLALRDLQRALRQESVDESDILELVKKIKDFRSLIQEKDGEFETVLDENLTPVQRGRYLIFAVEFFRGLDENLKRLRDTPRPPVKRSS